MVWSSDCAAFWWVQCLATPEANELGRTKDEKYERTTDKGYERTTEEEQWCRDVSRLKIKSKT